MTKNEALQLALDSMEEIIHWYAVRDRNDVFLNFVDQNPEIQKIMKSITAIKEALETKEGLLDRNSYLLGLYDQKSRLGLETKDEPVAWGMEKDGVILDVICPDEHEREEGEYTLPLFTTPQRTWVGLTDEEHHEIVLLAESGDWHDFEVINATEAKLKEKNT